MPDTVTWVALRAVTVSVDELPALMDAGLAVISIVGAGFAVTVTVAVAVTVPPLPVAVAVYVVVVAGLTACVPPAAPRVYVLPSEPLSETCVELVVATVRIDELPAVMDAGAALIVTVGAPAPVVETVTATAAVADPPLPEAVAV